MRTLTVVITTFNEQANIRKALNSVKWVDEIIVVDGFSTDETVTIAKQFTEMVINVSNNEQLNINKNLGFSLANSDWILSLDADEEVSRELALEIRTLISQQNEIVAYEIPRRNFFLGKWIQYGNWYPDFQIRLFMRDCGWFSCQHIHEHLIVSGDMGIAQLPLIHYAYPSLSTYVRKFNRYTSFEAKRLILSDLALSSLKIGSEYDTQQQSVSLDKDTQKINKSFVELAMHFIIFKPVSHFFDQFIYKKGFLDGWRGGVIAFFSAIYYQITFVKYVYKRYISK